MTNTIKFLVEVDKNEFDVYKKFHRDKTNEEILRSQIAMKLVKIREIKKCNRKLYKEKLS